MSDSRRQPSELSRALKDPEQAPLKGSLQDAPGEERVLRMWRGIERRSAPTPKRAVLWAWALAATFVLVAAGAWLWLREPSPGPLYAGKAVLPSVLIGAAQAKPVQLSDGSQVTLVSGARLEVLRNDGRSFVTVLRRGEGTFDIRPGGPRRWVIEAGSASVEVLGTRFRVARADDAVTISVQRGVVLVRGETVPAGAMRLHAGEQLRVQGRQEAETSPPAPVSAPAPASAASSALPPPSEVRAPKVPSAQADDGRIDQLLRNADAARRTGNTALAISELQRVLASTSEGDPRRGLAALSLARLALEQDPALAAEALARSRSSMPRELSEDAHARQVEALIRAGKGAEARQVGSDYLQRYPQGRRVEDVKRWLGSIPNEATVPR